MDTFLTFLKLIFGVVIVSFLIVSVGLCYVSFARMIFCFLTSRKMEAGATMAGSLLGAGLVVITPKLLFGWNGFPNSSSDVQLIAPFGFGAGGCVVWLHFWSRTWST